MNNHLGFSIAAFLVTGLNLIIVVGILVFVPYMLLSINRRLGRVIEVLEEIKDKS